jgi:hypothetical protein
MIDEVRYWPVRIVVARLRGFGPSEILTVTTRIPTRVEFSVVGHLCSEHCVVSRSVVGRSVGCGGRLVVVGWGVLRTP